MKTYKWTLLAVAVLGGFAQAQDSELGSCEAGSQREVKNIEFIIESRKDTDGDFVAKEPCTNKVVKIKRCAVIKLRDDKAQHYCHGAGKPTYFEEVDEVQYWETTGQK